MYFVKNFKLYIGFCRIYSVIVYNFWDVTYGKLKNNIL